MNHFKLGLLVLLGACATDELPSEVAPEPPLGGDYQPVPEPAARVRDLAVTCATELDGIDYLRVRVDADLHVASAYTELVRDADRELVEMPLLNFPRALFTADGVFYGFSRTEGFNEGKLAVTSSPVTCADVASFGVMVVVDFEDGDTACAFGGDPAQASALRCPE